MTATLEVATQRLSPVSRTLHGESTRSTAGLGLAWLARGFIPSFRYGIRPEVIDFYRVHGFEQHTATLMRVRVQRPV